MTSAASHQEGAHPLLGWSGGLDSATLLPSGFRAGSGKAPFVLLGAGWAELGAGRLVAEDPVIRAGLDLVDLSVPGFSMDQDLLLLERTLPNFRGGQVLLWIDVDRLDHLQRTFVGRPKPWYTPTPSGGKLQGVPVEPDIRRFLEEHPADQRPEHRGDAETREQHRSTEVDTGPDTPVVPLTPCRPSP